MKSSIRLAHYVLRTNQLGVMKDWYCALLGARVNFENERIAFLTFDEEHHRIALVALEDYPPKPSEVTTGFYHAAFSFDSLEELLSNYVRLRAIGREPYRCINHGPTLSFYYSDPERNDVELQVDTFPDSATTNAWMHSEALARNPIGVPVVPDESIKRRASGVPEAVLLQRGDVGHLRRGANQDDEYSP